MSDHQSLLKHARLAEQSDGRFKLFLADEPGIPVSDIQFQNRKAARNWARGRGYTLADVAPDGSTFHGPN